MIYWFVVPALALAAILQATFVPLLAIGGFKVDLPLLIVVAWGLLGAPGQAAVWGLLAGLFLDLLSGLPFGTQTLALTSIGLLLGLTQTTIFRTNLILPPAAAFAATFAYNIVILAILNTLGWAIQWDDYALRVILPTAILNMLALPLVYFPLQRLYHRWYPRVEW